MSFNVDHTETLPHKKKTKGNEKMTTIAVFFFGPRSSQVAERNKTVRPFVFVVLFAIPARVKLATTTHGKSGVG